MILLTLSLSVCLIAAFIAALTRHLRTALIALWFVSIGTGGVFLSQSFELLAVVVLMGGGLVTAGGLYFASSFGLYRAEDRYFERPMSLTFSVVIGLVFALSSIWAVRPNLELTQAGLEMGRTQTLAQQLANENFLSVEALGLSLLMCLICVGVLTRLGRTK